MKRKEKKHEAESKIMWHFFLQKAAYHILSKVMIIWEYAKRQKQLIQHRKAITSLVINIYFFSPQPFYLITVICTTFRVKDNVRPAIISSFTLKCSLTNCSNKQQYKSQKFILGKGQGLGKWVQGKICRNICFLANVSLVIQNLVMPLYLVFQLTEYDFTQQQRLIKQNLLMNSRFL